VSSGHPRNTPGGRFNFVRAQLRRIVGELALPLLQDFPDIVGDAHRYVRSSKYLPGLICIQDNFARDEIGGARRRTQNYSRCWQRSACIR
jgi:hypothetical protein